jgi:hypothetical protein
VGRLGARRNPRRSGGLAATRRRPHWPYPAHTAARTLCYVSIAFATTIATPSVALIAGRAPLLRHLERRRAVARAVTAVVGGGKARAPIIGRTFGARAAAPTSRDWIEALSWSQNNCFL